MRCSPPGGLVSLAHNRASRARVWPAVARIGSRVTRIRASGARTPPSGVHAEGFDARVGPSVARTLASGAGKGSPGTGILSSGAPTTKGGGVPGGFTAAISPCACPVLLAVEVVLAPSFTP